MAEYNRISFAGQEFKEKTTNDECRRTCFKKSLLKNRRLIRRDWNRTYKIDGVSIKLTDHNFLSVVNKYLTQNNLFLDNAVFIPWRTDKLFGRDRLPSGSYPAACCDNFKNIVIR